MSALFRLSLLDGFDRPDDRSGGTQVAAAAAAAADSGLSQVPDLCMGVEEVSGLHECLEQSIFRSSSGAFAAEQFEVHHRARSPAVRLPPTAAEKAGAPHNTVLDDPSINWGAESAQGNIVKRGLGPEFNRTDRVIWEIGSAGRWMRLGLVHGPAAVRWL